MLGVEGPEAASGRLEQVTAASGPCRPLFDWFPRAANLGVSMAAVAATRPMPTARAEVVDWWAAARWWLDGSDLGVKVSTQSAWLPLRNPVAPMTRSFATQMPKPKVLVHGADGLRFPGVRPATAVGVNANPSAVTEP